MSKYEVPPVSPDAATHLNNILLRADREFKRQVSEWAKQLDVCWCAPVTHGENARSMEDMQAIIDADPAKFQMMLSDSVAQVQHFMAIDAAAFVELVEPRHLVDGAYTWAEGELKLEELRPEWDVQTEEV
jgi:delta-aminolevulinic acid dehydratase/porphobilinogen synthase